MGVCIVIIQNHLQTKRCIFLVKTLWTHLNMIGNSWQNVVMSKLSPVVERNLFFSHRLLPPKVVFSRSIHRRFFFQGSLAKSFDSFGTSCPHIFESTQGRPDLKEVRNYMKKCLSARRLSDYFFFFYFSPIFRLEDYPDYFFYFSLFSGSKIIPIIFFTFPLFSGWKIIPIIFFTFPYFPARKREKKLKFYLVGCFINQCLEIIAVVVLVLFPNPLPEIPHEFRHFHLQDI